MSDTSTYAGAMNTAYPGGKKMAAKDRAAQAHKKHKKGKKFIQSAIKHPGALHSDLGVPQGQKIPASKLAAAAKQAPRRAKAPGQGGPARSVRPVPQEVPLMARVPRRKRLVQGAKLSMQSPDARDSARGANQPKRDSYGNV